MRDCNSVLKSMRICLAVDRDSNCLSECFGCNYISHDHHVMDMVRDAADAIEELLAEVEHWKLEAAANETDRNYLIDENRKLVNSLMNFRVPTWVSVEERLPEINDDVLVCNMDYGKTELGFATDAVWDGDNFLSAWNRASVIHCVTHWMPLPKAPEPPKGVE